MVEHTPAAKTNTEAGHLSVQVDGLHAPTPTFSFERPQSRVGVTASVLTHLVFGAVAVFIATYAPTPSVSRPIQNRLPDSIVWLAQPGPGGGGGGGGNQSVEPPKKVEVPGEQKLSVPAVKPPAPNPEPPKADPLPEPETPELKIPAKTLGDAEEVSPGLLEGAVATLSLGTGTGGGAGTGEGTGIGPGKGSGLGPGEGGGTGGGYYRPGNGVELPRVIREVRPQYTADAMRAKVQGTVWVECVVLPDGTVGEAQITKSLDSVFGLDQEALKAARQWRFVPGRRFGQPVPVLVTIELTFTLR
ncbi:MAG TPA: energy transducer TonB [Vicinamibacterales bacterium]